MKNKRCMAVFAAILIFSELIGFRLWAAEEISGPEITSLYVILSVGISTALGMLFLRFMPDVLFKKSLYSEKGQNSDSRIGGACTARQIFLLWAVLFACYIPCLLAFYPGLYNNDMVWQWGMYVSGNYNAHHPLIHTFLTGSLFELGKKVFGSYNAGLLIHSVLQLLIVSGSAAFALKYLIKTGASRRIFMAVLLFYALYPYIPVTGISTTKDTVFGALFLILFVMLCEMVQNRKFCSGMKLAAFFVLLVLSGLFRNNAVYGYLIVTFVLALWALRLRFCHRDGSFEGKLALLLGVGIIIIEIGLMLLSGVFQAEKGKINEMLSVPSQQLARTFVNHGSEWTEEEREQLFAYIPEENLQNYVYYISDPVKNNLNDVLVKEKTKDFVKLWVKFGIRYPGEYVKAFLNNTFGIWYLTGDTGSNIPFEYNPFFDSEHVFTEKSFMPGLKNAYKWFNYRNYEKYLPIVSMVFYTPFFNWIVLFCGFAAVGKRQKRLLLLPLFLLSYIFTIALGPCVAVRYLFNIILCAPMLLAVTVGARTKIEEERA